ncbi:MAG: hypothetical protein ABJG41_14015 [Cyclobacteriaceae bacterium]
MIISHKHNFIFIKPKKTAGTSIEIALSKICGDKDILTPLGEKDERKRLEYSGRSAQNYRLGLRQWRIKNFFQSEIKNPIKYYKHISASCARAITPSEIWDSYFKFSVERNPFDKIVSLYFWRGGDQKYGSLNAFIKGGGLRNFKSYEYYSEHGVVCVDKVYQFEHLDKMCEELSEKFALEEPLAMPSYRAKSHTRKESDYRELFDAESIELIKIAFAREIRMFEYTF